MQMEICCCAKVYLAIARRGSIDAGTICAYSYQIKSRRHNHSGSVSFS